MYHTSWAKEGKDLKVLGLYFSFSTQSSFSLYCNEKIQDLPSGVGIQYFPQEGGGLSTLKLFMPWHIHC